MIDHMREYGSEFDWEANSPFLLDVENVLTAKKLFWYRSGRDALKAVAMRYSRQFSTVFLPALCCASMMQPFTQNGYKPVFYKFTKQLTADLNDIKRKMPQTCLFLYMNYFGTKSIEDQLLKELREEYPLAVFIEDRTHDWLVKRRDTAFIPNYTVSSVRKWLAIPDAAYLETSLPWTCTQEIEYQFAQLREEAMKLKSQYHTTGKTDLKYKFRMLLNEATEILDIPNPPYAMSPTSQNLLKYVDFDRIVEQRMKNVQVLKRQLNDARYNGLLSFITEYPENSTLYFPILVENQSKVQTMLAQQGVYCPVIWPTPHEARGCCRVSEYIAKHMLGLPCDQRYNQTNMNNIAVKVMQAIEKT